MEQQKYSIINKDGIKCWIRYSEDKIKRGSWNFVFPSALSLDEISKEISKKFEDEEKFNMIIFKHGVAMVTINSDKAKEAKEVFQTIKKQL